MYSNPIDIGIGYISEGSAINEPLKFFNAPRTKYILNYVTFFLLLMAYSTFVLTSIKDRFNTNATFFTRLTVFYMNAWYLVDLMEEMLRYFDFSFFDEERIYRLRSIKWFRTRMKRYFADFWKVIDLLSYVFYLLADSVNYYEVDETFTVSRRIYSLSLLLMYLRFLEVFRIFKTIGTTLVMIKEMIKDLFQFMLITLFVVLGVGIYYHANLWPDHQTFFNGVWTEWTIWTILYLPYWQLYGEPNLESLRGSDLLSCSNITSSTSSIECQQEDWTVPTVAAMYMLFSNILLVSLVIAMFSHTFERIKVNSEKLWHFEMYTVTNDFEWRPMTPYVLYPFEVVYRIWQCLRKKRQLRVIDPLNTEM